MDSGLKQRLIGAAVLIALAVIFLPMLVKGPAPDSGVSDLPLELPDEPRGETVTRDLPLLAPGDAPDGGAVGMQARPDGNELATVDTADAPHPDAADLASEVESAEAEAASAPALPATVAGGDYVVHFGSYGSSVSADTVVNRLRGEQLPAERSTATVSGKQVWRVRIGPYATRAEAETVRLRAAQVGSNDARVVALDATPARSAAPAASATAPAPVAAAPTPAPAVPAAAPDVGFVVQLGAFSNAVDAGALRDRVRGAGFTAFTDTVATEKGTLTRVKAGPVLSRAEAERLKAQLQGKTGVAGMVRSHP
ncbi:SPOR domain-containing protein [Luteimonas sp. R10]|uniref:SPOR domain-containing protein n=1 Tax=Luteimonas sp. R10 TaxID=3108176 RepID=UPI003090E1E8|nr:SPOR domain-containing protein [Luteimonas sp. R10]